MEQITEDWSVEFIENESKRMEILKQGFTQQLSAREVNHLLAENYCETLYARNIYEAALIYCFDHKRSYDEWKQMTVQCDALYNPGKESGGTVIPLSQVRAYVAAGSDLEESGANTAFITKGMQEELQETGDDEDFIAFILKNVENFSSVREKARYYFLKYTLFYIDEKIKNYLEVCEKVDKLRYKTGEKLSEDEKNMEKTAVEELCFLKPLKPLQRSADTSKFGAKNYMSPEEKKAWLEETSLTSGGIYDAMNYFYFGYLSMSWLELCLEMYPYFDEWPPETKRKIAEALGLLDRETAPGEEAEILEKLEDLILEKEEEREAQMDAAYDRDGGADAQKEQTLQERRAANAFRDFMLGKTDINRRTLIMFLLFINANTKLDAKSAVSQPRLNTILRNCGFSQLRPNMEFDRFVMNFMKAEDPIAFFEDSMEERLKGQKESVLYRIYENSYNHQRGLVRDMIKKRLL